MYKKQESEQALYERLRAELTQDDGSLLYVGLLLKRAATLFGQSRALLFEHIVVTYQELYEQACVIQQALLTRGVQPHDRILLLMHNSIPFYQAYYGILQAGAVVVPLNTFLQDRELAHIIKDADPRLIIAAADFVDRLRSVTDLEIITQQDAMFSMQGVVESACTPHTLSADAMAALLYTSGTTGVPKGVMLSSNNIMSNVLQSVVRFRPNHDERVFAVLPLFHSFAQNTCVWTPLFLGSTVIIVPKIDRRAILQALEHKPTLFLGVPALYGLLCLLKTAPLDSVKIFVSGGDALPDKIRAGFELLYRRKICSGYGLTEASPVISADFDDEALPTSTVGKPLIDITCKLVDEQGHEVPRGCVGELWVKGPNIMLGYYHAQEATQAVLKDGWLVTGDFAYMDSKGRLVITGRLKDLISHKGFKIYPQEVENILLMHPSVLRVGVIGKLDDEVGEVPVAFVQIKETIDGVEQQLKELCIKNLAVYKIPRVFIVTTDQLPTTATGKVDKKILRARIKEQG